MVKEKDKGLRGCLELGAGSSNASVGISTPAELTTESGESPTESSGSWKCNKRAHLCNLDLFLLFI